MGAASWLLALLACPQAPRIDVPRVTVFDEEVPVSLAVGVSDPQDDPVALRVTGLPAGAIWDPQRRTVHFTPDLTQGGQSWTVQLVADDGEHQTRTEWRWRVADTLTPPDPVVTARTVGQTHILWRVAQRTDASLDPPGLAGRTFQATVTLPRGEAAPRSVPVRVRLHGFGGRPRGLPAPGTVVIEPADPDHSYWWGMAAGLPEGVGDGPVVAYTQRRVLHLLAWVLDQVPSADPDRVLLEGASMGGAGALSLGLLFPRHFAAVRGTIGQTVPRNQRPSRLAQLSQLYGHPQDALASPSGRPVWDEMDLTRVLADDPGARDQWVFTRHGRDDPLIHFSAVVQDSPVTGLSFYEAVQMWAVGHHAVWDEGGHGSPDPVLGSHWWEEPDDWHPERFLTRTSSFPAFTRASTDGVPGDGSPTGRVPWHPEDGYAGAVEVAGDSGWAGDSFGGLNQHPRWDPEGVEDSASRWAVPLRVVGVQAATVDVTPRRTQVFRPQVGDRIAWTCGDQEGEVRADRDGVTVAGVRLTSAWQTLALEVIH